MNPFYLTAILSVTAALLAIVMQGGWYADLLPAFTGLNWLRAHFINVGTVTMFIFGTAPGLLARRLGGRPQSAPMTWAQWGILNVGYLTILIGMNGNNGWLPSAGAWIIFGAVALLMYSLWQIARSADQTDPVTAMFYVTAPAWLLLGIFMAVSLLVGWPAPGGRDGILEAHVHANVWGFLAFVVVATLADLFPRMLGTRLAHPRWLKTTYWLMVFGTLGTVLGPYFAMHVGTIAAMVVYVASMVLLLINLIATARTSTRGFPAAAGHLLLSYLWMIVPVFFGPFVLLTPEMVPFRAIEAAATKTLVLGWVLQLAMGGIPTILRGVYPGLVRNPISGPSGRGWWSVALVNLGCAVIWIANLFEPGGTSLPGIAVGFGLVALGVIPWLARLWQSFAEGMDPAT